MRGGLRTSVAIVAVLAATSCGGGDDEPRVIPHAVDAGETSQTGGTIKPGKENALKPGTKPELFGTELRDGKQITGIERSTKFDGMPCEPEPTRGVDSKLTAPVPRKWAEPDTDVGECTTDGPIPNESIRAWYDGVNPKLRGDWVAREIERGPNSFTDYRAEMLDQVRRRYVYQFSYAADTGERRVVTIMFMGPWSVHYTTSVSAYNRAITKRIAMKMTVTD